MVDIVPGAELGKPASAAKHLFYNQTFGMTAEILLISLARSLLLHVIAILTLLNLPNLKCPVSKVHSKLKAEDAS